MLAVLRQKNYGLLWSAGFISTLGDWVLFALLPFYIASITGSALATGSASLVELLPNLLLGSFAGVVTDRWNPKKIMIGADLLRAAVLLLLFAMRTPQDFWLIYIVAFLESTISVFFGPAKVVMLRRVVADPDLLSANALSSLSDNACRLAGPILAAGLFLLFGLHLLIFLDCLSYLLSALLVRSIVVSPDTIKQTELAKSTQTSRQTAGFRQQWLDGFSLLLQERWLLIFGGCMALSMLAQGIFNALLTIFAEHIVKMPPAIYGWFLSAQGIGGLLGGMLVGRFGKRLPPMLLLAVSLCTSGMLTLLLVNVLLIPLILVASAIMGVFVVCWIVGSQTILQRAVKEDYIGRILGIYGTTQMAALLIGTSGGGLLGTLWGIVPTLDLAALLLLLAGITCFLLRKNVGSTREV